MSRTLYNTLGDVVTPFGTFQQVKEWEESHPERPIHDFMPTSAHRAAQCAKCGGHVGDIGLTANLPLPVSDGRHIGYRNVAIYLHLDCARELGESLEAEAWDVADLLGRIEELEDNEDIAHANLIRATENKT